MVKWALARAISRKVFSCVPPDGPTAPAAAPHGRRGLFFGAGRPLRSDVMVIRRSAY